MWGPVTGGGGAAPVPVTVTVAVAGLEVTARPVWVLVPVAVAVLVKVPGVVMVCAQLNVHVSAAFNSWSPLASPAVTPPGGQWLSLTDTWNKVSVPSLATL